ncbi:MAG: response regulator [Methanoregula sp.]|jgi:two-component system chemotaxis sensor kinase CheA|nr:response regulator [Methanoregula sp.]
MTGSDEDFRQKLLVTFREEADEYLVVITQGLIELEKAGPDAAPDLVEQVYRKVHSLKGAARAVQLKEIGLICQNLENVFSSIKQGIFFPDEVAYDIFHRTLKVIKSLLSGKENPDLSSTEIIQAIQDLTGVKKWTGVDNCPNTDTLPHLLSSHPSHIHIPDRESAAGRKRLAKKILANVSAPSDVLVQSDNLSGISPTSEKSVSRIDADSTVRIAASRLDRLIAGSDDLLTTRLFITQRSHELEELMTRVSLWRWNQALVSSDLHRIRKYTLGTHQSPLPPDIVLPLQRVAEFIKIDHEFVTYLQYALSAHIRATERDSAAIEASTSGISDIIHDAVLQPVSAFFMPFSGFVREYSREMGKMVDLVIESGEIEMDRRILSALKDPLLHLINNCIDHGIEYPDIRTSRKKPTRGIIRIRIIPLSGSMVGIEVSDDGNGIDCRAIRKAAVRFGLITQRDADKLTDDEAIWLIFRSGLSINPSVTEISGRGLGLAIVEETITRLGGNISVFSTLGTGTTITLWMPIRLATLRGVVVRSGNQSYVIPMKQVSQVIRVRADAITSINNRAVITVQEETIGVIPLASALGIPGSRIRDEGTGHIPVIILAIGAGKIACVVDQVIRVQEIVVRPLGSQLRRVKRITGAVILGDGTVALVIDPLELIQDALGAERPASVLPVFPKKSYRVLVVEDSVTSRTLLQEILERQGCEVMTAIDGIEAFAMFKEHEFDMVVSDVDMPRMSGFTLTEKIRSDSRLSKIPVVLVTSLGSPEDETHGYAVGADAYVIKSDFEKGEFLRMIRRYIPSKDR